MRLECAPLRATVVVALLAAVLSGCAATKPNGVEARASISLFDETRQRSVPVELYFPSQVHRCDIEQRCPVAILGSGYGVGHTRYSFIASTLNALGYLVVAVQHELESDPPLATTGDLFAGRAPVWARGADNIRFVHQALSRSHPGFLWNQPVLVGHSNGGDIAAWLVRESPDFAGMLVTLDNRRVPLPRGGEPRFLSLRASDFPADQGVIPSPADIGGTGSCVLELHGARHNDMHDGGPERLRLDISNHLRAFLGDGRCGAGPARQ